MHERHTKSGFDRPDIYQIVLQGQLSSQWSDWFDGFTHTLDERGQTILVGPVTDLFQQPVQGGLIGDRPD